MTEIENVVTAVYIKDVLMKLGGSSTMERLVEKIKTQTEGDYIRRKITEIVRKIVAQSDIFEVKKNPSLFSDQLVILKSQASSR